MKSSHILSILFFSAVTFYSFGAAVETGFVGGEVEAAGGDGDCEPSDLELAWRRELSARMPFLGRKYYNPEVPHGFLAVSNVSEKSRQSPLIGEEAEGLLVPSLDPATLRERDLGKFVYIRTAGDDDGDRFVRGLVTRILYCKGSWREYAEIFFGLDEFNRCPVRTLLPLNKLFAGLLWRMSKSKFAD